MVELLVAAAVTALLLSSVCGIYFAVAREWDRQQGEGDALVATTQACSRLANYISQSVGAVVISRSNQGDTLALNLPADTAHDGLYVPIFSGGEVQYRSGTWLVFYLSDSSGSHYHTGDILWAATMNWEDYPWSVIPDQEWSLYYDEGTGRIRPLKSLSFSMASDGSGNTAITIIAISSYNIGTTEKQLKLTRTVCLRNSGQSP